MTRAKDAPRHQITISLPDAAMAQIKDLCAHAVAGIPGARLTPTAWATQAVLQHLASKQPAVESEAPAKGKRRAA